MSNFSVTILGCGSATPSLRHNPSAQAVRYGKRVMLIDCGEGTQLQMRRYGVPYSQVTDIFISHLHGDHFLGLPGLLSTLALHETGGTVTVHTFAEGAAILAQVMDLFCRERSYELRFNIIDPRGGLIYEDAALTVEAFPLYHRVPCVGFIFREKPKRRHIKPEMTDFYAVPHYALNALRDGADYVTPAGVTIPNARLTAAPSPSMSYAYASDTRFDPRVASAVAGVDVLYHETTFADDNASKAAPRGHSTARQAAEIARLAGVGRLVTGHYSKRYNSTEPFVSEASEIFPNVIAGDEGLVIDLI